MHSNIREQKLIVEKACEHQHALVQAYIEEETRDPRRQWVHHVLEGLQEQECVLLRTSDFVLLPDTERVNRYTRLKIGVVGKKGSSSKKKKDPGSKGGGCELERESSGVSSTSKGEEDKLQIEGSGVSSVKLERESSGFSSVSSTDQACITPSRKKKSSLSHFYINQAIVVNWLSIVTDSNIRTLRDLRGRHVDMLKQMRDQCMQKIEDVTGVHREHVMAYVHYYPSVYVLHVHFAYPYMQYNHRDVYRIHSLHSIISNLEIDGDYYAKADLQVSLGKDGELFRVMRSIRVG